VQSRRDQVDAYHFSVARLTAALAEGDPGRGEAPFRRASLGVAVGAMLAALIAGGAVLLGLLDPPAAAGAWRKPGAIVVEKETGTRFIYLNGELRPTANYTSAMLVAGIRAPVNYVPAKVLARVAIGPAMGIPGAPDILPAAGALRPGRWALCLDPQRPGVVRLDLTAAAAAGPELSSERILVAGPRNTGYVVWGNVKYPLPSRAALVALGLGNQEPVPAPAAWLSALPTGPVLAPAAIPRAGARGRPVGGRRAVVGDLFDSSAGGAEQYYVLRADGLAPVSRTEFALLSAAPGARPAAAVSPAAIAAAPGSPDRSLLTGLPDLLSGHSYQAAGAALCVRQSSPGTPSASTVVGEPASRANLSLAYGAGLLVTAPATGSPDGRPPVPYLITDTGLKYAVAGSDAIQALGYGGATAQVMPAAVLSLVPTGPALSVSGARQALP
jgi:type VII secretion protein EccB